MNAQLSFKKELGKPPVFTFRRSDGTLTWSKLGVLPIEHDLAHYAVETILRFRQAFYGLLDQGFTADQFELPRDRRPVALLPANLSPEAHQAEHIVGLLQTELICGKNPEFMPTLERTLTLKGIPFPDRLTSGQLSKIRMTLGELIDQWQFLPSGQQLGLPFALD